MQERRAPHSESRVPPPLILLVTVSSGLLFSCKSAHGHRSNDNLTFINVNDNGVSCMEPIPQQTLGQLVSDPILNRPSQRSRPEDLVETPVTNQVLGGIGNFYGAIAASFIIGLAENIGVVGLMALGASTTYRIGIAFFILIVTLIVKPEGLAMLFRRA